MGNRNTPLCSKTLITPTESKPWQNCVAAFLLLADRQTSLLYKLRQAHKELRVSGEDVEPLLFRPTVTKLPIIIDNVNR